MEIGVHSVDGRKQRYTDATDFQMTEEHLTFRSPEGDRWFFERRNIVSFYLSDKNHDDDEEETKPPLN